MSSALSRASDAAYSTCDRLVSPSNCVSVHIDVTLHNWGKYDEANPLAIHFNTDNDGHSIGDVKDTPIKHIGASSDLIEVEG